MTSTIIGVLRMFKGAVLQGVVILAASLMPMVAMADDLRGQAKALFGAIERVTSDEVSAPKAELGRALFWDTRLSKSGAVACASCHAAAIWGADSHPFSRDARGNLTKRHSQTVFNAQATKAGLRWISDRASGADQALGSITGSMGFENREDLIPLLRSSGYVDQFRKAYPGDADPLTIGNYADALQAYQMTLRTPAPFDRWLNGDDNALDPRQQRGLRTFINVGCAGCHEGPLFGGSRMHVFGVFEDYRKLTGSSGDDPGLMEKTGQDKDRHVFRVQPLRNVAKTAPYFHDGSVATLDQAVTVMARAQLGRALSGEQAKDISAFLGALTGDVPSNYRPVVHQ